MVKSTDYNGEVKMAKKQRKEMVHVPKIKEWIKKNLYICSYNRIFLNNEKEQICDIYGKMDDSQKYAD